MSAILSAYGNLYAGNAQANADQANALQQQLQGQQQRNISITKSQDLNVQNERNAGSIRAAYGAAGVDPNSGTPLEVMSDQATHGELNRQLLLWQGLADQQTSDTQASFLHSQATAARTAGYISAAGSLASGAEKAASAAGAF